MSDFYRVKVDLNVTLYVNVTADSDEAATDLACKEADKWALREVDLVFDARIPYEIVYSEILKKEAA
jgi:hypothetical protein